MQLLLVQACGEVYAAHAPRMPLPAVVDMLDTLQTIAAHAAAVDMDIPARTALAAAQAADKVLYFPSTSHKALPMRFCYTSFILKVCLVQLRI